MTIDEGLVAYLLQSAGVTDLIGTRLRPGRLKQSDTLPAVTYTVLSELTDYGLSASSGLPVRRLQLDVWGQTYTSAQTVALKFRDLLNGYRGLMGDVYVQCSRVEDTRSDYAPDQQQDDRGVQSISLDIALVYEETVPTF